MRGRHTTAPRRFDAADAAMPLPLPLPSRYAARCFFYIVARLLRCLRRCRRAAVLWMRRAAMPAVFFHFDADAVLRASCHASD